MLPDLLVVTDWHELNAYLLMPDGVAETVKHIDFGCDGQTNVPAIDFQPGEHGYRRLADAISEIIARYQPAAWGLACEAGLMDPLLRRIDAAALSTLSHRKTREVAGITVANVTGAFDLCAGPALAEPEHA